MMDRSIDTVDDPLPRNRARVDQGDSRLRALVGPREGSSKSSESTSTDLRSLVGSPDALRGAAASAAGRAPRVDAGAESTLRSVEGPRVDLAELVGAPASREDDHGWTAPESAQAGRRPRFANRRGGAMGVVSIAVAVAAVAMLAGTTTFALIQRATVNPAAEAMSSLREREAELRNEINGLQTSSDLLAAVVEEAETSSRSAAEVLPALAGRVDEGLLTAANSARAVLDSAVSSVPIVDVPEYRREVVNEQSLEEVGRALDEVRRSREVLPPLIAQVRNARSGVSSALDDFRYRLGDLGASLDATAERVVQAQGAAGEDFRQAVTNAAAQVLSVQQTGADGLAEMASFAEAVDALNLENARVLARQSVRTPNPPPSRGVPSPVAPTDPGGTDATELTTPSPGDSGAGSTDQPSPSPSEMQSSQTAPTP